MTGGLGPGLTLGRPDTGSHSAGVNRIIAIPLSGASYR